MVEQRPLRQVWRLFFITCTLLHFRGKSCSFLFTLFIWQFYRLQLTNKICDDLKYDVLLQTVNSTLSFSAEFTVHMDFISLLGSCKFGKCINFNNVFIFQQRWRCTRWLLVKLLEPIKSYWTKWRMWKPPETCRKATWLSSSVQSRLVLDQMWRQPWQTLKVKERLVVSNLFWLKSVQLRHHVQIRFCRSTLRTRVHVESEASFSQDEHHRGRWGMKWVNHGSGL